jgi:hypothetical protein
MAGTSISVKSSRRLESRGILDSQFGLYEFEFRCNDSTRYALAYAWPDPNGRGFKARINDISSLIRVNPAKIESYRVDILIYDSETEFKQMGIREKLGVFTDPRLESSSNFFGGTVSHDNGKRIVEEIQEIIFSGILGKSVQA